MRSGHPRWDEASALVHSGDVMDAQVNMGTHTIDIDVVRLSKATNVKSLVFTMSAWNDARLGSFKSPEVRLEDPIQKASLCEYSFGSTREVGHKKSIVMAVLYRKSVDGRWEIKALGDVGDGDVGGSSDVLRSEMKTALRKIPS
jgi:stress response protein SCP2